MGLHANAAEQRNCRKDGNLTVENQERSYETPVTADSYFCNRCYYGNDDVAEGLCLPHRVYDFHSCPCHGIMAAQFPKRAARFRQKYGFTEQDIATLARQEYRYERWKAKNMNKRGAKPRRTIPPKVESALELHKPLTSTGPSIQHYLAMKSRT